MKFLIALFCGALMSSPTYATPFADADPGKGKALHDKTCISCHTSLFGGDGSKIYTRDDRKTKTAEQLLTRVSACNINTGVGWFPEDEANVAAYLNQQYYKFK